MKILVKAPNWLGDAVMSLPALQALREMQPDARLGVLTRRALADLYRAAIADEILPYDGALSAVKIAREGRWDAALILPRSFASALMIFGARIPRRIGYRGEGRSFMLTDAIPRARSLLRTHRVHYYHHLLKALGEPPAPKPPRLRLPPEAVAWALDRMGDAEWIGINPGATYGKAKQWYPERFIETARRLKRRAVVVGGPAEADLGARVAGEIEGALNLAGRTDLLQLAAVIARCRLFITNDTGPMHVADAVGTPIVAVFGPTDPVTTPPFGERHTLVRRDLECSPCLKRECPLGHHECMKRIGVDDVVRACERWLT
ncbi:MAG: lipopolysaccharide heptosyltransferase II [Planctomycetes bacterium]|nr:lipopolysaccharide heptosyltransferase II [Planctomycetota bacterium]